MSTTERRTTERSATKTGQTREMLYAPAAPFAEAIREWLALEARRTAGHPFAAITTSERHKRARRTPGNPATRYPGIEKLARDARLPSKTLHRYLSGESEWIQLDNADRLTMALGVPLWTLAEEFLPIHEVRRMAKDAAA